MNQQSILQIRRPDLRRAGHLRISAAGPSDFS